MARPYSNDLRGRVVGSVVGARSCRATAALFGVSVASVVKWSQRYRATGSTRRGAPRYTGVGRDAHTVRASDNGPRPPARHGKNDRAILIDEIIVSICPAIDGAKGAASIFDSGDKDAGIAPPIRAMTLASTQVLEGGVVWLRYRLQNG